MTIDEAIWFEEASGLAIDQIFNTAGELTASKARVMKGAAYVALKQANPDATPADAGGTRLADVSKLGGGRAPLSPSDGD
jgi:hypothetical protein